MTATTKPYTAALRRLERLDNKVETLLQDPTASRPHVASLIRERNKARRQLATLRRLASEIFMRYDD